MEICAVKKWNGTVRYTVSLAFWSALGDDIEKRLAAGHVQKVTIRAFVHPTIIKGVADAFRKRDNLMAPIIRFVLHYVEKESVCVKEELEVSRSKRKICELPPLSPTSCPSENDDMPSRNKKGRLSRRGERKSKEYNSVHYFSWWWCVDRDIGRQVYENWRFVEFVEFP